MFIDTFVSVYTFILIEFEHIALGHEPVAQVGATHDKRFAVGADDVFAFNTDETGLCFERERRQQGKQQNKEDVPSHKKVFWFIIAGGNQVFAKLI